MPEEAGPTAEESPAAEASEPPLDMAMHDVGTSEPEPAQAQPEPANHAKEEAAACRDRIGDSLNGQGKSLAIPPELVKSINFLVDYLKPPPEVWVGILAKRGVKRLEDMKLVDALELAQKLNAMRFEKEKAELATEYAPMEAEVDAAREKALGKPKN
jgi:hypothetical protein